MMDYVKNIPITYNPIQLFRNEDNKNNNYSIRLGQVFFFGIITMFQELYS